MSLHFLEEEFEKLTSHNAKFGAWENKVNAMLNRGQLFSLKLYTLFKGTPIDWDTIWVVSSIGTYTLTSDQNDLEHSLNLAKRQGIVKSYEKRKLGYEIISKDNTPIRFLTLVEFLPNIDDKLKERLQSHKRSGHCHWDSIHLSENLQIKNRVVSGYCTLQSKRMPFSHSWVEIEHNGKEYVIDFTMNEVMNKEGYYKLFNPQNIVAIDKETLVEDIKLMRTTSFAEKDIRMYLFHPDEARQVMLDERSEGKRYKAEEFPWIMREV